MTPNYFEVFSTFAALIMKNMLSFPNCKINLGLFVTEKRPDGYHNIETVFYPVPFCDMLEIIVSDKNEFTTSGIEIPGSREANLCLKAYDILKRKFSLPCIKIHLHKQIPAGAGLGGGSSDAAYTIKLLNDIFSLKLSIEDMLDIASTLGSDCAFFIENKPVFATNKGDVFTGINPDLSNYHLLLVKPAVHVSTPEAYSMIKPGKASFPLTDIASLKMEDWKKYIINDFEEPVFLKHPEIRVLKETMYNYGAVYASMSGSGSAVYGIFKEPLDTEGLFKDCFLWQGKL